MVGITGEQFLRNSMNWDEQKLAIMFMVGYERPAYDPNVNHVAFRMQCASNWLAFMGGVPPVPPTPPTPPEPTYTAEKEGFPWAVMTKKLRNGRNRNG